MTFQVQCAGTAGRLSVAGRGRLLSAPGEPLFLADWERALFLHFEVDRDALERETPFDLECFGGRAFVSLVAFNLRRMRPRRGGRLTEWLMRPMSAHEFLNVRTYVQHRGEPGIQFLAEWLPNRLSVGLGPIAFGLPYRLGRLDYRNHHETGELTGSVAAREGRFEYHATIDPSTRFEPAPAGTLDEFLIERYTAYTWRRTQGRFFRVWHEPWRQVRADVGRLEIGLLEGVWPWFRDARFVGAHYSPGVHEVWMGWPHRIR